MGLLWEGSGLWTGTTPGSLLGHTLSTPAIPCSYPPDPDPTRSGPTTRVSPLFARHVPGSPPPACRRLNRPNKYGACSVLFANYSQGLFPPPLRACTRLR